MPKGVFAGILVGTLLLAVPFARAQTISQQTSFTLFDYIDEVIVLLKVLVPIINFSNITADSINANDEICLVGDCRTDWPTGGGGGLTNLVLEQFTGINCTGSDGDTGRVLETAALNGEPIVMVDKFTLRKTDDFTISSLNITFIREIWNSNEIDVYYAQNGSNLQLEQFTGSDCDGSDGDANRNLTTSGISSRYEDEIIVIDKMVLRQTDDYTISGNVVTFTSNVWDSQEIDIYYVV